MMETLPGYDAWKLGGDYRSERGEAYCHNPVCSEFNALIYIDIETEYGRSYWRPDTCPQCGHELHEEPREEEECD